MSFLDDFGGWEERRSRFVAEAKKAAPGLPNEQIVPGAMVTLSPNLATGDRSYISDIYEVIVSNGGHVICKPTGLLDKPWKDGPHSFCLHEHEFYPAEHLIEALRDKAIELAEVSQ